MLKIIYTPEHEAKGFQFKDLLIGELFTRVLGDGALYKKITPERAISLETLQCESLPKDHLCQIVHQDVKVTYSLNQTKYSDIRFDEFFTYRSSLYRRLPFVGAIHLSSMTAVKLDSATVVARVPDNAVGEICVRTESTIRRAVDIFDEYDTGATQTTLIK